MRRPSPWPLVASLPFLWTCCPTLWLQVNKDSPAPWPSVHVTGVDGAPLTIPVAAPNRFDVLLGGRRTVAAPYYTDVVDPKDEQNGAFARANLDLAWIERSFGAASTTSFQCGVKAHLWCLERKGAAPSCHQLTFPTAVQTRAVVVSGLRATVLTPGAATNLDVFPDIPAAASGDVDVCIDSRSQLSRTLLSFVHMSDIQLRDPSVTLSDRTISHQLDWFDALGSFEYDEDLASYNQYLLEATVATINAMVAAPGSTDDEPKFVIHTGDSIDSNAVSELRRFHVLIDRLRIPFFELFGNHDVLAFGNLTPTATHDNDDTCASVSSVLGSQSWLVPHKLCVDQQVRCPTCVGDEADLVARTTHRETRDRFMCALTHLRADRLPQFPATGSGAYCAGTLPAVRNDTFSRSHGFDLGTADDKLDGRQLGYYAFVAPLAGIDRKALFVALDSEELEEGQGGVRGRLSAAQLAWLQRVLSCTETDHARDLVFVFAHQPLSQIDVEQPSDPMAPRNPSLAAVLSAHPNVVGYFYGHSHRHAICEDGRSDTCTHFWEIETSSLIEFPQEGRLVRIKQIDDDLAFLELTALRERLTDQSTDLARYVSLARRGAERDYCHTKRETTVRCSADQRPYRADGRDANARLFFRLP
jgi:3',5'-cyclic AMP phosphodiesterase CpdA